MNQSDILTGSIGNDNEERSGSADSVRLWTEGCEFETHRRHCVVSLSKALYALLGTSSTQEDRKMYRHD